MGVKRLSGLALMNIHYLMDINLDTIVNNFALKHPRKMELFDIQHVEMAE